MMQDNLNQQENQMSKPNTDQPTPLVVAGEATEVPETTPVVKKKLRTRISESKPVVFLKEHKTAVIATVGLGALVGGSAYLGRKSAPSTDLLILEPLDVTYDDQDELDANEADTTVA